MRIGKITMAALIVVVLVIPSFNGCRKIEENKVYTYLENAEIQYENVGQKDTIKQALEDALKLPLPALKVKRYKDYSGTPGQWDLKTLIKRYIVPDAKGKNLGNNFYKDVKAEKVQKQLEKMLKKME